MPPFDIPYPTRGIHKGLPYSSQPEFTSPDEMNVRSYDPVTDRMRGAQRPGHSKFYADSSINGSNKIQAMRSATAQVNTVQNEALWSFAITTGTADVHYDAGTDHTFASDGAIGANNTWRLNADGDSEWSQEVHGGGVSNVYVASDLSVMFVSGNRSGGYSTASLDAIDPVDGTAIASHDVTGGATYSATANMRVVPITGGYRIAMAFSSGAPGRFFVIDYTSSTQTFSEVWELDPSTLTSPGVALPSFAHIDAANTDKLYIAAINNDTSAMFIGKYTISTNANDWKYSGIAAAAQSITSMDTDGGSYIYVTHFTHNPGPGARNITKINDPASTTPTEQAFADTGTSFTYSAKYVSDAAVWFSGAWTGTANVFKYSSETAGSLALEYSLAAPSETVAINNIDSTSEDVVYAGGQTTIVKMELKHIGEKHRKVTLVVVSGGTVYTIIDGILTAATAVSGTLSSGQFDVQMAEYGGKLYVVDGTNYQVVDTTVSPATDTGWASLMTAGALPTSTGTARLIATYRARIGLSGIQGDEHNVYFTRLGDPLDIDASPMTITTADPVVLNTGDAGQIADVVTALIPVNDDMLFVGGDRTISVVRGDPSPLGGGQVDRVSQSIGIRFGKAWALSPDTRVFFVGTDGDIYWMQISGDQISMPRSLTGGRIDASLKNINPSESRYFLEWDVRNRGLCVYITPHQSISTTHFFWEEPADAWHPMQVPNVFGPVSTFVYDGDMPADRAVLLGGRNGIIRRIDYRADDDDGTAISSHVVYPPIHPAGAGNRIGIRRWMPTLGSGSDAVSYDIRVANNPESALTASALVTGTWTGGRNSDLRNRAAGNTISLKLYNSTLDTTWSVDQITVEGDILGPVRP